MTFSPIFFLILFMILIFFLQDAIISANLLHVHYDPKYWKNPEEFNPLRFYDETSNTFVPNERMVAFSIGKRYCLGQSLAEKEYFLFFSNILQKFTFDRSEETLPKIGRDSSISGGVIRPAPLYKTILKSRSDNSSTSTHL